jgi:hypothetical protein
MALVDKRKDELRGYLRWARQNDNEKFSYRMTEREDIKHAGRAAKFFRRIGGALSSSRVLVR